MGTRVVPSQRLRHELDALIAGAGEFHDPIEAIGRLGAGLIGQQALEAELTESLGRARTSAPRPWSHIGTGMSGRRGSQRHRVRSRSSDDEPETRRSWGSSSGPLAMASRARTRWRRW